jgi:hypothetical protein
LIEGNSSSTAPRWRAVDPGASSARERPDTSIRSAGTSIRTEDDQGRKDLIAYGERSHFVTSVRIPHGGRPSPDAFGLVFHVASPLQDSVGVITPSSLHYVATTRGSFMPDIDPKSIV